VSLNAPPHRTHLPPTDHASLSIGNITAARKCYEPTAKQLNIHYLGAAESDPCRVNGTDIGFAARTRQAVDLFHDTTISLTEQMTAHRGICWPTR
jgi:hypothetical protein